MSSPPQHKLKVIIACGGTGGHLYPGLSLGEEFIRRQIADVVYAVGRNDRSIKILKSKGCTFAEFPSAPFPRGFRFIFGSFLFLLRNIHGLFSAAAFIRRSKPDVVVGMGAYVSFPVILASKIFRVPVLIHEQNSSPGLANRFLSIMADKIAVSFPTSVACFNVKKVIQTGNPVRREIAFGSRRNLSRFGLSEDEKFTILVMGGSQGASAINRAVTNREFIEKVSKITPLGVQFIHLTGERDYEVVRQIYKSLNVSAAIFPYLGEEISDAYASSDMAICRAGATTIAEISAVGLPAVFIPYPCATDDHQTKNADSYISSGKEGIIIQEKDITAEKLASAVEIFSKEYLARREKIKNRPSTFHSRVLPQELIADAVVLLASQKKR